MQDGSSTSGGHGVGLPGVKRSMDDFRIESTVDKGTVVTAKEWRRTG
jgi:serine/threonine-protein kinase RsbT